jgi:hypothetical protein
MAAHSQTGKIKLKAKAREMVLRRELRNQRVNDSTGMKVSMAAEIRAPMRRNGVLSMTRAREERRKSGREKENQIVWVGNGKGSFIRSRV